MVCSRGTTDCAELNSADFVTENYDLKARILKQVDSLVRPEAIMASNSSSVSIRICCWCPRATQFEFLTPSTGRADIGP